MSAKLHPQAQAILEARAAGGMPSLLELTPAQIRAGMAIMPLEKGADVADVQDIEVPTRAGSIPARVYLPVADPLSTVVYMHGGGWVFGSLDGWDVLCRALAVESGSRVVSLDYRLAPEHRFPAAADDCYDATLWVAENLAGSRPLVIAGDSAGGNLAIVTAMRAREAGRPSIALQVLVYPVTDHDFSRASYEEFSETSLTLNKPEMVWFWDHYVPDVADRANPDASPLRATDFSGLPPAHVVVAYHDPLRDEGLEYAARLEAAGVPVTVRRFDDQMHAFFSMVNVLDGAKIAVAEVASAIRAVGAGG